MPVPNAAVTETDRPRALQLLPRTVTVTVDTGTQIGVIPLHRGHHAVWANARYQVDICNMVDDVVVRDLMTSLLYRFPINRELLRWAVSLISAMDEYDRVTGSPWACDNSSVRAAVLDAACRRIEGNPPKRNTLEPGMVGPAVDCTNAPTSVDDMLAAIIFDRPDALVLG